MQNALAYFCAEFAKNKKSGNNRPVKKNFNDKRSSLVPRSAVDEQSLIIDQTKILCNDKRSSLFQRSFEIQSRIKDIERKTL
jgi:hypothetical protein